MQIRALSKNVIDIEKKRDPSSVMLGGLPIARYSMDEAASNIVEHALRVRGRNLRPLFSTSANGQVLAMCLRQPELLDLMHKADHIHADGMPLVKFSRFWSPEPLPERVSTTDLVHAVAAKAQAAGVSFYFLGATEEVNAKAVDAMQQAYTQLKIVGRRNGYFTRNEEERIVADIRRKRPDILWVGLGFPLEQQFIVRNLDRLRGVGVVKTSGGLFDFLSGSVRRAPEWMQRSGLEWAYRAYQEPRRLALRYLITNPLAVYALWSRSPLR